MRIMHIITRFIRGGAQENTLLSLRGQAADNEVYLVTGDAAGAEGSLLPDAEKLSVKIIVVPELIRPIAPLADWRAYRRLRQIIRDLRPEVVHTHSSKAGILGRLAARREKTPFVAHTIHGLAFHPYQSKWKNFAYIAAEKIAARYCDKIITVADAMTAQAVAAGVAPAEKFVTVYSGMEVERFACDERRYQAAREKYGFAAGDLVIAKVARLFELKGHDYLFAAFADLARQIPAARLLIIGGGEWRERLEKMARELGFADKIVWTGLLHPDEVPRALAAADLVAHCSLREGLARVIPQSLLMGKPTVAFDVDGAKEILSRVENRWLVAPQNVAHLTQALAAVIADLPAAKRAANERGATFCREQFAWQTMCKRLAEIYGEREKVKGKR
ncbi:MAG: glycosyltransferase family 4 protein [Planctomycetota bacterium]|jgi:glycosyltransferase involved in cell wall biosynthesis|nr:glycosyltransferase family 4 protein [Planctomycetota bacterium]